MANDDLIGNKTPPRGPEEPLNGYYDRLEAYYEAKENAKWQARKDKRAREFATKAQPGKVSSDEPDDSAASMPGRASKAATEASTSEDDTPDGFIDRFRPRKTPLDKTANTSSKTSGMTAEKALDKPARKSSAPTPGAPVTAVMAPVTGKRTDSRNASGDERRISMTSLPKIQKRTSIASPQSPDRIEPISNDLLPGSDGKTPVWYEKLKPSGRRDGGDGSADVLLQRLRDSVVKAGKTEVSRDPEAMQQIHYSVNEILHALAFTPVQQDLLVRSRMLHRNGGLRKIFDPEVSDAVEWPFYTKADAEELFNKWSRKVFETDLLRGIKTGNSSKSRPKKESSGRNADSIDPAYNGRGDYHNHGNNGLLNGQWWPTQLTTVRDGAHGKSQSGISGKAGEGAYCVIMTGEGGYPDEDHGDWARYCGTDSKTSKVTDDTQLLLDSLASGRPVRFIRSHKLGKSAKDRGIKSAWAPSHGYRYDGVYKVTAAEVLDASVARHRFTMVRLPEQDPIRGGDGPGARPTAQEVKAYEDDKRFKGY